MTTLVTLLILAVTAVPAAAQGIDNPKPDPSPTVYWQIRQCDHGHRPGVAAKRIERLLRNYTPLTKAQGKDVHHYVVCTRTAGFVKRVWQKVKRLRAWRRSYPVRYRIGFNRYAWLHGHLASISACESHGSPTAVSANGAYRGKYQFSFSTWGVVGGSGDPAAAHEWEQDYRAALLLANHGAGHWPVCG